MSVRSYNMQSPPSPALSLCDTLSSPDLDAYLDSLPPLSSMPSPYMTESWWKEAESTHGRHDSFLSDIPSSFAANADVLCNIAPCNACSAVKSLPPMITQFLTNSRVPEETIALVFNILSDPAVSAMHCWHRESNAFASEDMQMKLLSIHGPESDASCQRALMILSALSLAVSYTEDYSRSLSHWSSQVAQGIFSTEQIGSMNRLVLAQLEWQLHPLAAPSAIAAGIKALSNRESVVERKLPIITPMIYDSGFTLMINPQTTIQHGLVIPESSPDCDHPMPYLLPVNPV